VLLEDFPGSGKTTLAKALGDCLTDDNADDEIVSVRRIQFTPDLLPGDLTGPDIYHEGQFEFIEGPLFPELILADEINRAPAKVQSALLEAMQERQVTIGSETHKLPDPFLVLATQNPIEPRDVQPARGAGGPVCDEAAGGLSDGERRAADAGAVSRSDEGGRRGAARADAGRDPRNCAPRRARTHG
jgi:hypothetical protein